MQYERNTIFHCCNILEFISETLKGTTTDAFNRVILVHNVGSMSDVSIQGALNNMLDVNIWREFYDLNFFVPAVLNAVVMNTFDNKTIKKTVINITSLFGIQPNFGCGQYCSVKATREMYFKVCMCACMCMFLVYFFRNYKIDILFQLLLCSFLRRSSLWKILMLTY